MRFVEVPAGEQLLFPENVCANCLSTTEVTAVDAKLVLVRFFGGGGVEYTLGKGLVIGHCKACKRSARRLRPGCAGISVAGLAWSVLAAIAVAVGLQQHDRFAELGPSLWAGPLIGLAIKPRRRALDQQARGVDWQGGARAGSDIRVSPLRRQGELWTGGGEA